MSARLRPPWRVHVATTSRADFSIWRPVLAALSREPELEVGLIVGGMHMMAEFGLTVGEVEASGYPIRARLPGLGDTETAVGVARAMGEITEAAAESLNADRPDLLLVLGDRFEMHALALAALPLALPVAHLHGGEQTEGAIDNSLRHSLTKLSHLHFCATELACRRVRAMGEDPGRVILSGAPALDAIAEVRPLDRAAIARRFGVPERGPFLLATYHPVSLDPAGSAAGFAALVEVALAGQVPVVFTLANADAGGRAINAELEALAATHPARVRVVGHFGAEGYYGAMQAAEAMVGNSSSGILEAANFGLPVVNIGDRQAGRERSPNVIDCAGEAEAIRAALARADSPAHRAICAERRNVYGDGKAGPRIVAGVLGYLRSGGGVKKRFFPS